MRRAQQERTRGLEAAEDVPIHPMRVAAAVTSCLKPGDCVALDGGDFVRWARWLVGGGPYELLTNGKLGALDRYDFAKPHESGGSDHSDGQLLRWVEGSLARTPGVPSHLAYEADSARVYMADTGHGRVVALDTASGTPGPDLVPNEAMASAKSVVNARLIEIVPPGVLQAPSGLEIKDKVLFVTDNATSQIYAFDLEGKPLRKLDTGLPAGTLAGIAIGPDDRVYIVDLAQAQVRRIDPR